MLSYHESSEDGGSAHIGGTDNEKLDFGHCSSIRTCVLFACLFVCLSYMYKMIFTIIYLYEKVYSFVNFKIKAKTFRSSEGVPKGV